MSVLKRINGKTLSLEAQSQLRNVQLSHHARARNACSAQIGEGSTKVYFQLPVRSAQSCEETCFLVILFSDFSFVGENFPNQIHVWHVWVSELGLVGHSLTLMWGSPQSRWILVPAFGIAHNIKFKSSSVDGPTSDPFFLIWKMVKASGHISAKCQKRDAWMRTTKEFWLSFTTVHKIRLYVHRMQTASPNLLKNLSYHRVLANRNWGPTDYHLPVWHTPLRSHLEEVPLFVAPIAHNCLLFGQLHCHTNVFLPLFSPAGLCSRKQQVGISQCSGMCDDMEVPPRSPGHNQGSQHPGILIQNKGWQWVDPGIWAAQSPSFLLPDVQHWLTANPWLTYFWKWNQRLGVCNHICLIRRTGSPQLSDVQEVKGTRLSFLSLFQMLNFKKPLGTTILGSWTSLFRFEVPWTKSGHW